jgi:hypothetical protein
MSPQKWIDGVNAIGIVSKAGRYVGTYATQILRWSLRHGFLPSLSYTLSKTIVA